MRSTVFRLLGAALLVALVACGPSQRTESFKGIDITGAEYGRQLSLPDADGQLRNLANFKGKVLVVFFGYTQCPDVCPTTMSDLAAVKKQLGTDGQRLQVIFVTVDPERDTPPLLKAYATQFDPSFVALRGSAEQVAAVAKEFKVFFAKVPGKTETSYSVDHTAGEYIFDARGKLRVFSTYGSGKHDDLVHDLKILLAEPA